METKDQILAGVADLFMRFGIKSVTMDDIASRLVISKKTIYQFYTDKDALVSAFLHFVIARQKIELEEAEKDSENVVEELLKVSNYMRDKICNINPAMMYDLKKYYPVYWQIYNEFKRNYVEGKIKDSLERGKLQGFFREEIDVEILARMRVEQVDLAFNPELFSPDKFKMGQIQMHFFLHFVYGIVTVRGHQLFNEYRQIIEE